MQRGKPVVDWVIFIGKLGMQVSAVPITSRFVREAGNNGKQPKLEFALQYKNLNLAGRAGRFVS